MKYSNLKKVSCKTRLKNMGSTYFSIQFCFDLSTARFINTSSINKKNPTWKFKVGFLQVWMLWTLVKLWALSPELLVIASSIEDSNNIMEDTVEEYDDVDDDRLNKILRLTNDLSIKSKSECWKRIYLNASKTKVFLHRCISGVQDKINRRRNKLETSFLV